MTAFRLLALMLCMAMSIPQLQAQTYTVAGSDTQALGASWAADRASNDMTLYSGNIYYLVKSVTYSSSTTYEYKITVNHSWNTSYGDNGGSGNASYAVSAGSGFTTYVFNSSTHVPRVVSSRQTVVIAGDDTQALGSSTWNGSNTANSMTTTDGITYTLTKSIDYTSGGTKQCKAVVAGNQWFGTSSNGNVSYNIPAAGSYTVTYTFNAVTGIVTVDVQSAAPVIPDYYITGDTGLGLSGWSYNQFTTLIYDAVNDVYTYSYNVTSAGTYYFAFADGAGSDWNDFNGNHRYGPSSGNETVTLDSWATTQKGGGSYEVTVDAGQVTITLDVTNMRYKVEGTAPVISHDYYVMGTDTSIFPNGWSTGSNTQMTDNGDGTYTWTSGQAHLATGTNYEYKVYCSDGSYHPSGNNATFNVSTPGTYTVTVTYDSNTGTVTATPNVITPDPSYTYDIYVRYTGSEPVSNVNVYAWDSAGTLSAAWSGTALSTLTSQVINGHTYYHVTYTSYSSTINVIFNENGTAQTADLTANPGDNYYTYGGGNTVSGPNAQADAATVYYVVGADTSIFPNGWNTGNGTNMTNNNGTYTWTSGQVHLAPGTNYEYRVLGDDGSYHPDSGNETFNVNTPGTYTVTVTYDSSNETVTAVATLISADPLYTYDIYVRYTGDEPIGNVYVYAWDGAGILSDAWNGSTGGTSLSTLTSQVINGHTYYHVTYTSYSSTINVIFNENGSSQTADLTANPGDNYFTYGGGNTVSGPNAQADAAITYYVVGDDTSIFPNGWNTGNGTNMTNNGDGTYSWTSGNVHLDANEDYAYKVRDNEGGWYPDSGNENFNVNTPGTYTVTVTYDSATGSVTATTNLITADPANTINIYVRYTGEEDVNNVYMHAWDANGDKTTWPGMAFANMTHTVINGHTYYTISYTGYISQIGLLFNENGSNDTKTADLTATPGDNYFTYGGGSTVSGPNAQADAAITSMYIIGIAGSQQWAANAGIAMEYDSETGYYSAKNVVLTALSHFAFATELGSNSDDWATLNAHRYNSKGNSHFAINENWLNKWMTTKAYADDNHNWYVELSGAYDIDFNPDNEMVRVRRSHDKMYISYGVGWNYQDNSLEMTTVDGNIYQATIEFTQGDYFLFSTALSDETAWGATSEGYEITNLMIGFAQKLQEASTDNFYFNGTTGKYIVVVNLEKGTVTLRKTADVTVTKVFLQKTSNVTLDPAGGTYNGQTLDGKRGGIYAWNKLNLEDAGGVYQVGEDGATNYTYEGEVGNNYLGDNKLKDLPDTTTVDGKEWYAWSIGNSICEFYFIRKDLTDLKSQKVMRRAGEVWLIWTDEDATSDRQDNAQHCDSLQNVTSMYYDVTASGVSDCATMLEDHYYVYYTNTTGWDSVYCYAWSSNPFIQFNGVYPGNKCTFVGYDEDGYEVWCYDFGLIEDFHRTYGTDGNGEYIIPTGIIFNNGIGEDQGREQTGDLVFDNGACYDYLGMVYLGNSLAGIIANGIVNGPKYTVEDNLVGVYYDEDALTEIMETDMAGNPVQDEHGDPKFIAVRGALYAKDMENYSAKSIQPDGTLDYVYQVCKHKVTASTPGGSQIQIKRDHYDQSNWVKIVLSPNFDNTHLQNTDVTYDKDQFDNDDFASATANERPYLEQYVGKIIPGGSMSGNLVNNVNPQMHITNIAKPLATPEYEKNVYVTANFNDSVVFSYVHQDWSLGIYDGVYRTVPVWKTENGQTFVDHMRIDETPTKMFYVAPKPQEVAYITWAVFDHPDATVGTRSCQEEPSTPGAFYAPMNWDRTGQLWDGQNPADTVGGLPYGSTYGPYSNGYMQYAAFQVNWSLFEDMGKRIDDSNRKQLPWYQIFKPGHAYKILALVRYAHGDKLEDVEYTPGVYSGNTYNDGEGDHVANAPRRAESEETMTPTKPFKKLNESKFIVFPLQGSGDDSYGDGLGDVTAVKEVKYVPTSKDIVSVRYYNLMGVGSDQPFDGMNIVVTTYSDGSPTSKKILR